MPSKPPSHDDDLRKLGILPNRKVYDRAYEQRRWTPGTVSAEVEHLRKSTRWAKVRDIVRMRDPLCVLCRERGLTTPTQDIDHIVPARVLLERGDALAFFDATNLRGLCRACHNREGAR